MKRFRFKLEELLRIRRVEEKRQLQELRKQQSSLLAKQSELDSLESERALQIDRLRALGSGPLPMETIFLHQRYLNALHNQSTHRQAEFERIEVEARQARETASTAARDRKAVERLRERRYEEFLAKARRSEVLELDEMFRNVRALRRKEAAR